MCICIINRNKPPSLGRADDDDKEKNLLILYAPINYNLSREVLLYLFF
jgi:hypothetical protein